MLPTKLKRKLAEDKGALNGKGANEKDASVDAESDYEFEVILFL